MNISPSIYLETYPQRLFAQIHYFIANPHESMYPSKHNLNVLNFSMDRLGELVMPQKTKKQQKQGYQQIEFVNISLTKAEKDKFKSWFDSKIPELPDDCAKFMAEGYKISFRWDNENECYICSATCIDETNENNNKCLTSRSDNWLEAFALNLFKTNIISNDGVWESSESGYNWG